MDAEPATLSGTSLVRTVTSKRPTRAFAPSLDPQTTGNAKTKAIVDGAMESGRTVHAPAIKSAASLVGTASRTSCPKTVRTTRSRRRASSAQRRLTVTLNFLRAWPFHFHFAHSQIGSCKSIKHYKRARTDGEYKINIRGREVEIYCHNMNSNDPVEYVTLRKGNQENYSLFYSKRSTDVSRCENGKGTHDESIHYGTTRFNKVRLNINTLQIVDDDYQFSQTVGRPQKFATGGDCYSNTGSCPQGDFFVNFEGTGFRIRATNTWQASGTNTTIDYQIKVRLWAIKLFF